MQIVYRWRDELRQWLPSLGAHQAEGLAMFCYGIIQGRHSQLRWIAEELGMFGTVETVLRRLNRWLSNPRLVVEAICNEWVGWVWSQCAAERAVLLVDETKISDRMGVMMVSLAYEKRAIPLMWRCYKANSAADYPVEGQVGMIEDLIRRVVTALPQASRPLVLADRGIGYSSDLMKRLRALGVKFVLRIRWDCRFTARDDVSALLKEWAVPEIPFVENGYVFTGTKRTAARVHIWWETGHDQPWCLATNDVTVDASAYAWRVWQEESFRDLKSGGWHWHTSFIRCPRRMERFLLILAIAYGWMVALGTAQPARSAGKVYSVFRRGVTHFKALLARRLDHLISVHLAFFPLQC